jgi:hypothetical protein
VRRSWPRPLLIVIAAALALAILNGGGQRPASAADSVDEIHLGYGNDPATSMWVYWRGAPTTVDYGLTTDYDQAATAAPSAVTPVDISGPFSEVLLSNLTPATQYHYRIGATGDDHTFSTGPTGDFTWDDIGDTGSSYYNPAAPISCNKTWMPSVWSQILSEDPAFVTHGGDIDYANECGSPSVHQLFQDISGVASTRPVMFTWGNHEYGSPNAESPPGTPRDVMNNYKGRFNPPNPQTVPNDTPTQTSQPGCLNPGGTGNGCRGEDWGSFQVGHVLFISEPEEWPGAWPDWQNKAGALMAAAQSNPDISLIVTYGHRPAYTSVGTGSTGLRTAVNHLGDLYSPQARPDGKYVLNIGHHVHGGELFAPQHGVVQIVDGGGGTEQVSYSSAKAGSQWRTGHFEHLRATVTGATIRLDFMCGPVWPIKPDKEPCTQGSVIHTSTVSAGTGGGGGGGGGGGTTQFVTNPGLETSQTGWTGVYNGSSTVTRSSAAAHSGSWSLRLGSKSGSLAPAGVNNVNPVWVTNSTAGTPYSTGGWVRATTAGTTVRVVLKELSGASTVATAQSATLTLNDTAWHQLPALTYTAAGSGHSLKLSLISTNLNTSRALFFDDLSMTAPS